MDIQENDDFTYFSATSLNENQEPEETFRFNKNTRFHIPWIQVSSPKC